MSLPLHVALSPIVVTDITEYSPSVQMAQYGVTLALLAAAIVAVMIGRRRLSNRRLLGLLAGVVMLTFVVVSVDVP